MNKKLVLAWQDADSRKWLPVGLLKEEEGKYFFRYTKAAKEYESFKPFGTMTDYETEYVSDELFPLFSNRLLAKSRPEYDSYLSWLDLTKEDFTPLEELARSSGIRATDSLQLFAIPEPNDKNEYEVSFFSHGIRYLPACYIERIQHLKRGDRLFLMQDVQNHADPYALALRTDDPPELLGYCPSFFVDDFNRLLKMNSSESIMITVEKVNLTAPIQYRLLCKIKTHFPEGFVPFEKDGLGSIL